MKPAGRRSSGSRRWVIRLPVTARCSSGWKPGRLTLRGPVVDRELPLEQAAEAHRLIEELQTFGKVVLKP
jgi:NADPH:quinone reductase-like Zn-dependent oxidoreductase